jgi:hypothetical protein
VNPTRLVAFGLLLLCAPRAGEAQRASELRLEAGTASVSQRGFDAERAALLAVLWRRPAERWTFLTSGNLTYAADSLAAAQGVAVVDLPWNFSERLRTEIGAAGASFSLRSAGRGGNGNLFARQHFVGPTRGSFVGIASGRTTRDGIGSDSWSVDAGLWKRFGMLYLSGALTHFSSSDWPLLYASGVFTSFDDERFRLLDKMLTAQVRNGPHDFTLNFIARDGQGDTDARNRTMTASGTLQLTERVAVLASGGRQLADPLRGLPQADLVTFSARVSFGPKPLPVMQRSVIAEAGVVAFAGGGGELVVRVLAVESMLVEVAGDFSDWEPLPMEREGTFWVARARLHPGKHRVAVRVNLGEWRAPRNLARVRDDYGGEAGLVVVP